TNYWVDVVLSQHLLQQTTAADFNAGTTSGTVVTNASGGEVQLAPSFSDDFNGTSLSSSWKTTAWPKATPNVSVSIGTLSVAGAEVLSVSATTAPVEGRIAIGA